MDIEPMRDTVDGLKTALDKCGLYAIDMTVIGLGHGDVEEEGRDIRTMMKEDGTEFMLKGSFILGKKVAFSDRVLHPEKYDDDKTFREMMPTSEEMLADKMRAALEAAGNDPEAIFALFDDDDDDDDDA